MQYTTENGTIGQNFGHFVGSSPVLCALYDNIEKLANASSIVLIQGETGTGKELCAQGLHRFSSRKNRPFVTLNCAQLDDAFIESALFGHRKGAYTGAIDSRIGAVEQVKGGTLFLDEIGDLSLSLQARFLRFCENFEYRKLGSDTVHRADLRLLCASNKDLSALVQAGQFRQDLFYRLQVSTLTVPPLRSHTEDIKDLSAYYLTFFSITYKLPLAALSDHTLACLKQYDWPGNVRELKNLMHHLAINHAGSTILSIQLPETIRNASFSKRTPEIIAVEQKDSILPLWQIEKMAIDNALAYAKGNIIKAASLLEIAPSTIYRKLQQWQDKA